MWLLQHSTGGPRGEGCGVGAQPQLPGGVRNVGACGQQRAPRYQTQHQHLANVTPSREVASLLSPLAPSLLPAPTQPPSPASGPPQPPAPKVIWGQGQPVGQGGLPEPHTHSVTPFPPHTSPGGTRPCLASHLEHPSPEAAPDAAPPVTMATPILAGLPWLPGPGASGPQGLPWHRDAPRGLGPPG